MTRCSTTYFLAIIIPILSTGCSTYNPLNDKCLYQGPTEAPSVEGVKITFLGNTTLYITDGQTGLLVDGFVSRPGPLQTLIGKIGPNPCLIRHELDRAKVGKVNAVLVGHAHHDHALDAPYIALWKDATVMGSESYAYYHNAFNGKTKDARLITVEKEGLTKDFGSFTVSFRLSQHVSSHFPNQTVVEGDIKAPLKAPSHYSHFKQGDVFVIHISHPQHGSILVTTTAGAETDQLNGLKADVVFLGVGLLAKESPEKIDEYWEQYVEIPEASWVIPTHWDDFARKLTRPLKPPFYGNIESAMEIVKLKGANRKLRVMDRGDSIMLSNREVIFRPMESFPETGTEL